MKTKTNAYTPLDYLEGKEEISEYLNNAFMDDDPQIFLVALGHLAKKKVCLKSQKKPVKS